MIRRTPNVVLLAALLVAGGCGPPRAIEGLTAASAPTAAAISESDLQLRAGILADDSLRGRETGKPGAEAAAEYIGAELGRLGFQPGGDGGSYLQHVPLVRKSTELSIEVSRGGTKFPMGLDEVIPISGLAGLPEASLSSGGGPLLYAGHLIDPDLPNGELTAEQVQGAVVLLRIAVPPGVDPTTASPRSALTALFGPASTASAVLLVAEEAEAQLWDYASEIAHKGELILSAPEPVEPGAPPFFLVSTAGAERLLGGPLATAREPRTGLGSLSFTLTERSDSVDAWNVVGILQGSDSVRADEYVALGGHYDHVGVGAPIDGDSIYNGADDNASGTSVLLEVAEEFGTVPVSQRPARSLLFVWHTAEESGLLGSEYFTNHPSVPRGAITAHVNLDMVGRNSPDSIFVVGASRLSAELGRVVERVNGELPDPFALDYAYDPVGHPEMIYCRSDHYSYARYGIPIVFLTSGMHEDYHAPSDEVDKLNYGKMRHVSAFVSALVGEIANRPQRFQLDKPVPALDAPCR